MKERCKNGGLTGFCQWDPTVHQNRVYELKYSVD